jgi:Single-strand binding protein family
MSYLNSVTIVGLVGADPEQRQARNNGSKFTVLSVATQRSWKNAEDEWVSKVEWHRIAMESGPRSNRAFCTSSLVITDSRKLSILPLWRLEQHVSETPRQNQQ